MRTILGIERISEYAALFDGRRIGLITNFSGVLPDFSKDTADVFAAKGWTPVKLFTPEHGLYGAGAGESVDDSVHPRYGIPVISLYGDHRAPTKEDLEGIDILVYDIQDVGLRYYTYIYTMCYALDAAARYGIPFVVLDRPNPLGNTVSGPRISGDLHDFVGDYTLPLRYGLTPGEVARYYVRLTGIDASLHVIPMTHYDPASVYPQTGLLWNVPSPAIPTFQSALCYCGGCLFEPLQISEGRGTGKPFQIYGAPYVDMDLLYERILDVLLWEMPYTPHSGRHTGSMISSQVSSPSSVAESDPDRFSEQPSFEGHDMTTTGTILKWGMAVRKRSFTPSASDFSGQLCYGIELLPVRPDADTLSISLILMKVLYTLYGDRLFEGIPELSGEDAESHLALLYGTSAVLDYLKGMVSLSQLHQTWYADAQSFLRETEGIRIYE